MTDWVFVAGIAWMFLIASLVLLALFRISASVQDEKLLHSGVSSSNPLHAHLRQVIHSEDRIGIALTIGAFILSVALAFMLADQILRDLIQKLAQVFFPH
jgi:hypothetical protein